MKKMLFVFAILGGIFLAEILCPKPVQACDYCLITQGLSPLETTHGLGLRLNGRYTVLNSVFTGSNEVENHDGEKETHLTTELTTFYNVSDRFTLIGILSLPRRKISLNIAEDHGDEHDDEDDHHDDELVHSHNANGSAFSVGDLNVLGID